MHPTFAQGKTGLKCSLSPYRPVAQRLLVALKGVSKSDKSDFSWKFGPPSKQSSIAEAVASDKPIAADMVIAITIIHVIVSIGLILVVLLQTGKADMGAVFGGSSSTIFGSSGASNFLTRLTTGMAIVFMITSLTLGYFAGHKPSTTIFDSRTPSTQTPSAVPETPQPQGQSETTGKGPTSAAPASPQGTQPQESTQP
jgi:preprotein translocase subunit SecG